MTLADALALAPGDLILWRAGAEMPFLGVVAGDPLGPSMASETVHVRVLWSCGAQSNTWPVNCLERLA